MRRDLSEQIVFVERELNKDVANGETQTRIEFWLSILQSLSRLGST